MPPLARITLPAPLLACALLLAACGASGEGGADAIAVSSTDTACEVASTRAPAGEVTFRVTNGGSQTTEFYVYEDDGTTIVGEVEGIGPGLTRDLTVVLQERTYVTACKPGEQGDGIRGEFVGQ